ncbi:hypothetical protein [Verrucomicrobium spinosum]|uniref:hypothetical protein n=1 Tax=Verrucomicrobium spinosum TaxID=2736 RepID=UPI00017466B5|nr:hypothetical protein [Verrucomicrobium spinosum]
MVDDLTDDEIEDIARESPVVHFGSYLSIFDKDNVERVPKPNILQIRINEALMTLKALEAPVRLLVTKIRQCGGSTFSLEVAYHEGRNRKVDAVIIADVGRNSEKMLTRLEDYKNKDQFPWDTEMVAKHGKISLTNGTTFEIDSAQNWNAGISRTRQVFLASETPKWSRSGAKNDKRIMAAVLPSIPKRPGTVVISEGTPFGASGWQYEQWQGALTLEEFVRRLKAGESNPGNGWVKIFAGWFEFEENQVPITDREREQIGARLSNRELAGIERYGWTPEQIAWRRATIDSECGGSEEDFDQYYPEDDVSCWLSSGRPRFDMGKLVELETRARSASPETGRLVLQDDGEMVSWSPDFEGKGDILIWEQPKEGCRYLVSCDPATGSDQTESDNPDRHSISVWRAPYVDGFGNERRIKMVARVRPPFQGEGDLVATHITALSAYYGGCIVVLEINMGLHILELLKARGVPLYKREVFDEKDRDKPILQYGFKLKDRNIKRAVVDCLAIHIRERAIEVECLHWIGEAKSFMIDAHGKETAPSGQHDDDVMQGAMGVYSIGAATLYKTPQRRRRKPRDWRDWTRAPYKQ